MEINEGKLKEILNDQRNEFQHFMGIVKEDLHSQIQLIGEQYQGIKNDISGIRNDITDMSDKITIIQTDISFIKSSLKRKVDYEEFEELTKRVALLESRSKK